MGLVPSAAYPNTKIEFHRGIDGSNSESQTRPGYALEAVNVDISIQNQIEKRVGYTKWASRLPVRVGSILNIPASDLFVIELETTFVATLVETELQLEFSPSVFVNSAFLGGDMRDTCLLRLPGNKIPITENTLFSEVNAQMGYKFSPLIIYDDETVLMPAAFFKTFSTVATSLFNVSIEMYEGLSLPRFDNTNIETIVASNLGLSSNIEITFKNGNHGFKIGSKVLFETGVVTNSGQEYVVGTAVGVDNLTNTLSFNCGTTFSTLAVTALNTTFFKMRYGLTRSLNISYKNEFLFHKQFAVSPTFVSLNSFTFEQELPAPISFFEFVNGVPLMFVYGLPIDVGAVSMLGVLTNANDDTLVTGYEGIPFKESKNVLNNVETLPILGLGSTSSDETILAVNGLFTLQLPFTLPIQTVFAGDEIFWDVSQSGPFENSTTTTVSFSVVSANLTTAIVDANDLESIFIPRSTVYKYRRKNVTTVSINTLSEISVIDITNLRNVCSAGRTFRFNNSELDTPIYSIVDVNYENYTVTFTPPATFTSDETIAALPFWKQILQPDNVETSLISIEDRSEILDLPTETFDFSLYTNSLNNGLFRFNGVQFISGKLPAPPTPLIRNIPGSGGTLEVVQGDNNKLVGRRYNFIVTYSYFEIVDGVSRKIESGITPETDVSIVAEPALDGSISSQKVELQVASIPRGLGLPADSIFINVYRTLEGIDESGVDTGQYLLERSILNNPDNLFTSIIVGDVPSFDFNNANADRLYTTIQSDVIGNLANNASAPNSRYIANYSNRLLALNCAKDPYFEFTCQKVFDTLTRNFKAYSKLEALVSTDVAKPYARFVTCPVGEATTVGSGVDFSSLVETDINYSVLSMVPLSVTSVVYNDQSHILTINKTTNPTENIIAFRFLDKSGTASTQYDIDFEGQTFKRLSSAGSDTLFRSLTQKTKQNAQGYNTRPIVSFVADSTKAGDVIAAPSPTVGFFVRKPGLVKQDDIITKTLAEQPLYLERDNANSTTLVAGDFFIVQGLGTSIQILDKENGRVFDLDREIVFQRVNGGVNQIQVKLFVVSGGRLSYLETYFLNKTITNNIGENINPQFTILKMFSPSSTSDGKSFDVFSNTVTNTTIPPTLATITTSTPHGVTVATDNTFIALSEIGQIPSNDGVNYSGMFKVASVVSTTQLSIVVTPSNKVFRSALEGVNEGSKTGLTGKGILPELTIVPTATDITVSVNTFTNTLTKSLYAGSYCFVIASGADNQSHSFQLSGYFKIKHFLNGSTVRKTVTTGQTFNKIVLETNGTQTLSIAELSSLEKTKIIIMTQEGYSYDSFAQTLKFPEYIPVPVPVSTIDDLTSSMFATRIADTTPLAKVIKRFALAINSVLRGLGFAYWGSAVTSNSEPFPANGFRFIARNQFFKPIGQSEIATIPTTFRLTSKQDKQIPGQQKSIYTLKGKSTVNNTTDAYTSGLSEYLREYEPNRIYWTDAASVELSRTAPSFKDNTFFKDLPSVDGEVISAVHVFQNFLLIFKANGLYRGQFNGNDLILERVQSPVGSIAYKNIVSNETLCYFLHVSGVYMTDGYNVTPVMLLKEPFKEFVQPNARLFRDTCGVSDTVSKLICIGVPYDDTATTEKADNQFVYNYFEDVKGWTRNTQFYARWWTKRQSKRYFAGNNGFVYILRYEESDSKYLDDDKSIPFRLKTLFLGTSNEVTYKFFREMILQYGPFKDSEISISMSTDYNANEFALETFKIPGIGFGYSPFGKSPYGGDGQLQQLRRTTVPNRSKQISFIIENNKPEQNILIAGIYVAAEMGSNTMTKQNAT